MYPTDLHGANPAVAANERCINSIVATAVKSPRYGIGFGHRSDVVYYSLLRWTPVRVEIVKI